jgi:predicted nucleic acid-binding protein
MRPVGTVRFIDSNIFIYHLRDDPHYGSKARAVIGSLERQEACTSTLVIHQVLAYLKAKRLERVMEPFLGALSNLTTLKKLETLYQDFVQAAQLREETGLSWALWDDLVIAAQMRRAGIAEICSNDEDFDRIPGVRRVF